ncbi:c-type cytochrome [soil metagenome]
MFGNPWKYNIQLILLQIMNIYYNIFRGNNFVGILIIILCMIGCAQNQPNLEIISLPDAEAELEANQIEQEVSAHPVDGFEVSLWASETFLGDPIALDMDQYGRAWVTVTNRSWSSEIDIRSAPGHWLMETLKLNTVEERRNFLRTDLSPERSDENTWITDYNEDGLHDWRDLAVKKEEVWRLEDLTGNGRANQGQLFIRDFHDEITDVAGAVAWHDGEVFLGVGPDMWRLSDTNQNGMADAKESISHGYNVRIGYSGHGMSGLNVGPDGRIYWAIGDIGLDVTDGNGKRWHLPDQGAILRSDPDGSNFEVFATGLRNTHDITFDKYGNLIAVDNQGNLEGEFARLLHLVDGSDSGWRIHWQFGKHSDPLNNIYHDPLNNNYNVWRDEAYFKPGFEGQSAHILPPIAPYHSGPAGLAWNPGSALDENWKDYFFSMSFLGSLTSSAIHAFTLKENGASFELESDQRVLQGILAVGLDFGPDGALYMTDWVEGWQQKDRGRIWKMDVPGRTGSDGRMETKNLLAEEFAGRSADDLAGLLEHKDMRVRQKTQFELANRADRSTFLSVIAGSGHQLARIHGIWGIGQIARAGDLEAAGELLPLLEDPDSEVRAQAFKMLGDVRYEPAADAMMANLRDDHPRVRFFAAEALGRIGYTSAAQPIVDMLEANNDQDLYLRHGGIVALARIGDADFLAGLDNHPSAAVRIAAVAALKRLGDPAAARFLRDEDEFVVANAARAINDGRFIAEGLPELARLLDETPFVYNEPLIRRSVNANLYNGADGDTQRLALFSLREDVPDPLRLEALHTLSAWPEPSLFDRVTGQYRGRVENDGDAARRALESVFHELLAESDSRFRVAVIEAADALNFASAIPALVELLTTDTSAEVRIASLGALKSLHYERMHDALAAALNDDEESVRLSALGKISNLDLPEDEVLDLLLASLQDDASAAQRQIAFKQLGVIQSEAAYAILNDQFDLLLAGEHMPEVHLDLMLAAEQSGDAGLGDRLEQYRRGKPDDSVAVYRESLKGGDANRGRELFQNHPVATCTRCHAVGGQGGVAGPDLTEIGSHLTREQLLQSLVDPQAGSGMPAMGNLLTRHQLRDLVEYLSTLPSEN